jgi:hypothetical protein
MPPSSACLQEKGTPITSQELLILFQEHINGIEDTEAAKVFVNIIGLEE